MSESLPEPAPLTDPAVTSVEDPAPVSEQEVVTESAPGSTEPSVPAARFNGLMGKFNQTQNALTEAQRRIAELEAVPPAKEEAVSDVSGLQEQVNQLTSMLMQERLESARAQAIQDFPGAKAFADLIVADSPEAIRDMAKVLHERVNGSEATSTPVVEAPAVEQPPAATGSEPPASTEAAPPVVSGGTTIEAVPPDTRATVVDAIKNKDFTGFLAARFAEQHGDKGELVL